MKINLSKLFGERIHDIGFNIPLIQIEAWDGKLYPLRIEVEFGHSKMYQDELTQIRYWENRTEKVQGFRNPTPRKCKGHKFPADVENKKCLKCGGLVD